jgi:hypothetical protein
MSVLYAKFRCAREQGIDLDERLVGQQLFSGVDLQFEVFFADLLACGPGL